MKRNYLSGAQKAQKRKHAEEQQRKDTENSNKISNFFKSVSDGVSSETICSAATSEPDGVSEIDISSSTATSIAPEAEKFNERSFSQLKRIKNPLRTTLTQDKLESLALLCIEA